MVEEDEAPNKGFSGSDHSGIIKWIVDGVLALCKPGIHADYILKIADGKIVHRNRLLKDKPPKERHGNR